MQRELAWGRLSSSTGAADTGAALLLRLCEPCLAVGIAAAASCRRRCAFALVCGVPQGGHSRSHSAREIWVYRSTQRAEVAKN